MAGRIPLIAHYILCVLISGYEIITRLLAGIHIDITAVLRAVFYIARVLACNISYLPEGASPRRRYFRIARRAPRARVLYDFTARMHEDDIVYIHQRAKRAGIALKTKYSPLVDIGIASHKCIKPPLAPI